MILILYRTPEKHYFRLHHCRPRFKNNIENVLIYVASEISRIGVCKKEEFISELNKAIFMFPGNVKKTAKTINNWRTEISSLFGFVLSDGGYSQASPIAKYLATEQDLIEFFKYFLYFFQYPGGHTKPHETVEFIKNGVSFKPAKYILSVLVTAENNGTRRFGLDKGEVTHCIFNDLRVTRDGKPASEIVALIEKNRLRNIKYEMQGDVTRYAKDILDYMVLANLLVERPDGRYYINRSEKIAIERFLASEKYFTGYEVFKGKTRILTQEVRQVQYNWFKYVNQEIGGETFKSDILTYLDGGRESAQSLSGSTIIEEIYKLLESEKQMPTTKQIGDTGENLVYGHECQRLKDNDREDLIHLVNLIPSSFAVGYDIQSVELDENKRYIEVKTTLSNRELIINSFQLTPNEWKTAETLKERYFVYRLMINRSGVKLFVIKDPVGKYKKDKLSMVPRDGAEIRYNPEISGTYEELLLWRR